MGLFSDTPREKAQKEAVKLHQAALSAYESVNTKYADEDGFTASVAVLSQWKKRNNGKFPVEPLLKHLVGVGTKLLNESGFYSPPPPPSTAGDLSELVEQKNLYRGLIKSWNEDDVRTHLRVTLFLIFDHILSCLPPEMFLSLEDERATDSPPTDIAFDLPAATYIQSLDDLIEVVMSTLFADEISDTAIFGDHRGKMVNTLNSMREEYRVPQTAPFSVSCFHGKAPPIEIYRRLFAGTALSGLLNFNVPLSLGERSRFKHQYVLGKTGSGKSVLLRYQIAHDIHAGRGLVIMTPERGLIDDVLSYVPEERYEDVVYFNAADSSTPTTGFNPFTLHNPNELSQKAGELEAILIRTLGDMGVKMRPVISNTIYALLAIDGTFSDIPQLLDPEDATFRRRIRDKLDARTQEFFNKYDASRYYKDAYEPIINRLDTLLRPPLSLTLSTPSLDFAEILNNRRSIVLCDMSELRGFQSEVTGQLLLSTFQQTFFQRDLLPEKKLIPYFFYMDEFQTYATSSEQSLKDFLTRARKYKTGIVMAHQNIKDIPDNLRASIFGNCGTLCGMLMSADDARVFSKESQLKNFSRETNAAAQMQNFKAGQMALTTPDMKKAQIIRVPEFPPFDRDYSALSIIKDLSRSRYGMDKDDKRPPPPPSTPAGVSESEPSTGWDDLGYDIS